MRLMRLPGEPASPPRAHSLVMLGAVLAETDVADRASSIGETAGLTLFGAHAGRMSGVLAGGDDAVDCGRLLEEFGVLLFSLALLLAQVKSNGSARPTLDDESHG
jgi:hypothetical protein